MERNTFRLDRTQFKKQSFKEADIQTQFWSKKSYAERLYAALYLIGIAYQFDISSPPRLDRTQFKIRKHAAL